MGCCASSPADNTVERPPKIRTSYRRPVWVAGAMTRSELEVSSSNRVIVSLFGCICARTPSCVCVRFIASKLFRVLVFPSVRARGALYLDRLLSSDKRCVSTGQAG
jgi:hypothetical protein